MKKYLDKEQIKELKELGIELKDKNITAEDILNLLPNSIPEEAYDGYTKGHSYLQFNKDENRWRLAYISWHPDDHTVICITNESLLYAAFEMLRWIIKNIKW